PRVLQRSVLLPPPAPRGLLDHGKRRIDSAPDRRSVRRGGGLEVRPTGEGLREAVAPRFRPGARRDRARRAPRRRITQLPPASRQHARLYDSTPTPPGTEDT